MRRLLGVIAALVASHQLVLMELAHQFLGATRVAAPLKALDRLLSNPRLQRLRAMFHVAALVRFWPVTRAVLVVDGCTLKRDESLHLLRAGLPVSAFKESGQGRVLDLGLCEISKRHPHHARSVAYKNPPRDRKHWDGKDHADVG